MVDPGQVLPDPSERELLLDALADLIAARGFEQFVCAPLLLPREEFFPDRWTASSQGVYRLARRLLTYAGLPSIDASIELFDDGPAAADDSVVTSEHHQGAAAWFAGIEDGVAVYGANVHQLGDALGVTAAMAHETAHAFRFQHGLMRADLTTEEQLTDLTTVYLGFGLLTTKVTVRHSASNVDGSPWQTTYRSTMLGYLPPQSMAFLLACHTKTRGTKPADVADVLEPNQALYFRKALAWLEAEVGDVAARLGVPERGAWPAPHDLEQLTAPLHEEAELRRREDETAAAQDDAAAAEAGPLDVPVLRLPFSRTLQGALVGAAFGGATAAALSAYITPVSGLVIVVAAALVGRWRGRGWKQWECSECRMSVRLGDPRCRTCGGLFVKDLDDPADRLEIDPYSLLPGAQSEAPSQGPYRTAAAAVAEIPKAVIDGSELPRVGSVLTFSRDVTVAKREDVTNLQRRLDIELPRDYADYVCTLGDGYDTDLVHVALPQEILDDPSPSPDGHIAIAQGPATDIAVHPERPGRLFLLSDRGVRAAAVDRLADAIEGLVGDRQRWFSPASLVDRGTLVADSDVTASEVFDAVLSFGPTYVDARDESLTILSPGLGGRLRLACDASGWSLEIQTDTENFDTAHRLERALSEAGFRPR